MKWIPEFKLVKDGKPINSIPDLQNCKVDVELHWLFFKKKVANAIVDINISSQMTAIIVMNYANKAGITIPSKKDYLINQELRDKAKVWNWKTSKYEYGTEAEKT